MCFIALFYISKIFNLKLFSTWLNLKRSFWLSMIFFFFLFWIPAKSPLPFLSRLLIQHCLGVFCFVFCPRVFLSLFCLFYISPQGELSLSIFTKITDSVGHHYSPVCTKRFNFEDFVYKQKMNAYFLEAPSLPPLFFFFFFFRLF